jgi:hypothetical protein
MKSRIVVTLLLNLFIITVYSQDSFEFVIKDPLNTYGVSTFPDSQDFFITVGASGDSDNSEFYAMILKYTNVNDIQKKVFSKQDTTSVFIFGFLLSNGNYFMAGEIDEIGDYFRKNLYIVEVDQDLNIVYEKIYGIPTEYNSIALYNLLLDADSNIIINADLNDPAPGFIYHHYFAKLNTQGDILVTSINTQLGCHPGSELVQKPDKSGYYVIGDFLYSNMIKLDNDLNVTGWLQTVSSNSYHGSLGARFLSSGDLIIGSLATQEIPSAFYDLRIRVCDTNLIPNRDTVIFDDGYNFLPLHSGLDFTNENNIWVATYPQLGDSYSEWEYGRIYIFDSDLNVKGAKYFGGSTSLYLFSLKALDDGGCIITGITPDDGAKGYDDVFIKKVMPGDIITNAEETSDPDDQDVLVYPIPFTDWIKIETYRKALTFSLFSNTGECFVLNKNLSVPKTEQETSHLNKGTYIYKISENGKTIQSGKIIKN